ncbi:hypothetical protein SAMN05192588_2515 [Nonlabens sp. Hel1_33_55]|nr:hypothetical protein SAMN05192588_2515 [Nonlabens sp. Hel1_33_55]
MLNKAVEFAKDSNDAVNTNGAPIINIKGVGIVYFLYLYETDIKETSLVYIGKSKGTCLKQGYAIIFSKSIPELVQNWLMYRRK